MNTTSARNVLSKHRNPRRRPLESAAAAAIRRKCLHLRNRFSYLRNQPQRSAASASTSAGTSRSDPPRSVRCQIMSRRMTVAVWMTAVDTKKTKRVQTKRQKKQWSSSCVLPGGPESEPQSAAFPQCVLQVCSPSVSTQYIESRCSCCLCCHSCQNNTHIQFDVM